MTDEPDNPMPQEEAATPYLVNRHMRYPNAYAWLLLLSAMDIMLTWVILHFGGREVNAIARHVIDHYGLNGVIIYKFVLILFFILVCEVVGSMREPTGRMLSKISVAIASIPIIWSMLLLSRFTGLVG